MNEEDEDEEDGYGGGGGAGRRRKRVDTPRRVSRGNDTKQLETKGYRRTSQVMERERQREGEPT